MTIGVSNTLSASIPVTIWKVECGPTREMNCFGRLSRDSGQTRVPAPPHMMTGRIFIFPVPSLRIEEYPYSIPNPNLTHNGLARPYAAPHDHRRLRKKFVWF